MNEQCPKCGYDTEHLHHDWNSYSCFGCGYVFYVDCPLCGGKGYMAEDDMMCDWINYDNRLVTCKECGGDGVTSDPSFQ